MAGNIASRSGTGKHFDFTAQLRDANRLRKLETAETEMTIKVGDTLPDGKLSESTEYDAAAGCPINPKDISVAEAVKGKKIAIFAVPGAYTPTCSATAAANGPRSSASRSTSPRATWACARSATRCSSKTAW